MGVKFLCHVWNLNGALCQISAWYGAPAHRLCLLKECLQRHRKYPRKECIYHKQYKYLLDYLMGAQHVCP